MAERRASPRPPAPTGCELAAEPDELAVEPDEPTLPPAPRRKTVPLSRKSFGFSPFSAAKLSTLMPARAAIALSVSPGWTT